jgi:hypothetical protein
MEEWRYSSAFLDLGTRQLTSLPQAPAVGETSPGTHWTWGSVGPKVNLDAVENRNILHCRESNPGRPARSRSLYLLRYHNTQSSKLCLLWLLIPNTKNVRSIFIFWTYERLQGCWAPSVRVHAWKQLDAVTCFILWRQNKCGNYFRERSQIRKKQKIFLMEFRLR